MPDAKAGGALYKLSDGGGLQLWVQSNERSCGALPIASAGNRSCSLSAPNPVILLADALKAAQAGGEATFRTIAEEYVAKLKREGRADTTLTKIEWLLSFAYPLIGVRDWGKRHLHKRLATLRTVEQRGLWSSEKIISGS